jgi:hypothetical protein
MAASTFMLGRADHLWAIWDGRPARGYGGTADVVAYARENGLPVRVIWPDGAHRDWRQGGWALRGGRGVLLLPLAGRLDASYYKA